MCKILLREKLEAEQTNIKKIADALCGYFRTEGHTAQIEALSLSCAYALYKARQIDCSGLPDIEDVLNSIKSNGSAYSFVKPQIEDNWKCIDSHYNRFSSESLTAFILLSSASDKDKGGYIEATPSSITDLSLALLNIGDGERVADLGAGVGTFLVSAYLKTDTAVYYGVELDPSMAAIAGIRAELLGDSVTVELNDMFVFADEKGPFDKIFSNYPFGMRLKNMRGGLAFMERLSDTWPDISKATSSDWVFNSLLISSLTEKGKAVGIMTNGSALNSTDQQIREYFVRNGFIETVIALPEKMFITTAIPTTLIVFSHGNESVRMIDAHEICQKGRRQNEFSVSDISKIASAITKDDEISKSVDIAEIERNEFIIHPMRYLEKKASIENGRELGDVAISITRGAQLTAGQLDEMTSMKPTNFQFLKLSNIQDGFIDEKLQYIKEIDSRYRRYRIRNGDLIISKNGLPPKIAVADVKPNTSVIANSNIYLIRLDEKIINPQYLKAYFESEQGSASLNRIAVGATLPTIGAEQLKKLVVPVPPLAAQQEFALRYLAKAEEVKQLKRRLEIAQATLKNMFGCM